MKSKLIILSLFALIFIGISSAHMNQTVLKQAKTEFNQAPIPDALGSVIGDQTINVVIKEQNDTEKVGVDMEGVKIEEVQTENYEDPTLEANISMKKVEEVANSENPIDKLNKKVQEGEIEYEAHGAVNSVKFFVAEKFLSLGSVF